MIKSQAIKLKKGDILMPNGSTKQSCNNKLDNLKKVTFISLNGWGIEASVMILDGTTKNHIEYHVGEVGSRITINLKHFKKVNDIDNDRLYDICG